MQEPCPNERATDRIPTAKPQIDVATLFRCLRSNYSDTLFCKFDLFQRCQQEPCPLDRLHPKRNNEVSCSLLMHIFRNFATLFHNARFLAQIRPQQTLGSTKSDHTEIKIRRIIRRSRFSCPWLPKSSQECERINRTKDNTWRYAATKLQFKSAAAIIFFFSSLLFSSLSSRPRAHSFPNQFSKFEISCLWDSGIIRLTFRESDPQFSLQFPVVL